MSKILVIAQIECDEGFICEAFKVYDHVGEWTEYLVMVERLISKRNGQLKRHFGRLEMIVYSDISDLTQYCQIKDITEDEANFILANFKFFGTGYSAIFDIEE